MSAHPDAHRRPPEWLRSAVRGASIRIRNGFVPRSRWLRPRGEATNSPRLRRPTRDPQQTTREPLEATRAPTNRSEMASFGVGNWLRSASRSGPGSSHDWLRSGETTRPKPRSSFGAEGSPGSVTRGRVTVDGSGSGGSGGLDSGRARSRPWPHFEKIVGMRLGLSQFLAPGPRRFHGHARRERGIEVRTTASRSPCSSGPLALRFR
jgi:hypothetical protein